MQYKDKKTLHLRKILGETIKEFREKKVKVTCSKLAQEYDLDSANLYRIENAQTDCKFITAWRIAEALGLKFSEFAKIIEDKLDEKFKLTDE